MSLRKAWEEKAWPRLALAFGLNLLFLLAMLTAFAPQWETNDDLFMSRFVDGQLSTKTAYVPFVNITLGWLLKTLYSVLGDGFNWYSACQYVLLLLSFTAISWSFLRRFRLAPALVITALLLGAIGTDCYLSMNFSKPAAVATVGGMALLLSAAEGKAGRPTRVLGILLGLAGYCWRFEAFGVCALICACACLPTLLEKLREKKPREAARYLAPFVLLAGLAAGLYALNDWAWHRGPVAAYKDFDDTRSVLIDFEIPEYSQMPEVYDALEMDEDFVYLMRNWSFYDTRRFTQENMETLIAARDEHVHRLTPGEILGVFLTKCLFGFTQDRPFAFFAFLLALWLACGRRRAGDWLSLGCMAAVFMAFYALMIYNQRYLANRVDIGFFLAMGTVLSFTLEPQRLKSEKGVLIALLALSLFVSWRACRGVCRFDSHNTIEDKSAERAAVETLLADGHLFFVKIWAIDHVLYTPLETPPAGYADTLMLLGNWSMHHPSYEAMLHSRGIENPWPDLVNREDIYLIDQDVERSLRYLRRWYYPDAEAEPVEPLSTQTGLPIYRVTG